jgi:glycerol-3-phosphate dehydrogenase
MGGCRRSRHKRIKDDFHEMRLLRAKRHNCYEYEEAYLPDSDARFVIQWILQARDAENPALNYCEIAGGSFDRSAGNWKLDLEDRVLDEQMTVKARLVVNAAGVWADRINDRFGIETRCRHALSKGVFIGIPRHPLHTTPLIFAGEGDRDCFTLIP